MSVIDTWADWTTAAADNSPAGTVSPEIDDELRNIKAECKTNLLALGDAQIITGVKTFNVGKMAVEAAVAGYLHHGTDGIVSYGFPLPDAAEGTAGIVALASTADALAGTATDIAITPEGLSVAITAGISAAANQDEQEAGTEDGKFVSPATQQFHPSSAKSWVKITTTDGTPTVAASYNVASITDVGTGIYTVSFTTAFSSVDYAILVSVYSPSSQCPQYYVSGQEVGNLEIKTWHFDHVTLYDYPGVYVVAYGDQ